MTPIVQTPVMDRYRREQAALGGRIAASAAALVRERLNVENPDRDWQRLLALLLELIRNGRGVSADLAMQAYRELRALEGVAGEPPEQPEVEFPTASIVAGLIWNGPRLARSLHRREPRTPPRELAARVGVMVGRSAMRQTLGAGREVTRLAVRRDLAAWGWARITDANPCKFCRMLADRGPVYKSARSASVTRAGRQFHDGCACSVVPVFRN